MCVYIRGCCDTIFHKRKIRNFRIMTFFFFRLTYMKNADQTRSSDPGCSECVAPPVAAGRLTGQRAIAAVQLKPRGRILNPPSFHSSAAQLVHPITPLLHVRLHRVLYLRVHFSACTATQTQSWKSSPPCLVGLWPSRGRVCLWMPSFPRAAHRWPWSPFGGRQLG